MRKMVKSTTMTTMMMTMTTMMTMTITRALSSLTMAVSPSATEGRSYRTPAGDPCVMCKSWYYSAYG